MRTLLARLRWWLMPRRRRIALQKRALAAVLREVGRLSKSHAEHCAAAYFAQDTWRRS